MTHLQPVLPGILLLLGFGVLVLRRWPRLGRLTAWLAFLTLFLWSWPPITRLTTGTLERWHPFANSPPRDAGAIVVLGGGLVPPYPSQPATISRMDTQFRAHFGAWLYKNWRALPILVTGGPIGPADGQDIVAVAMRDLLIDEGVPAEFIWLESESRSTYENALYSSRILAAKGIQRVVLVTEGIHMPRAVLCFRKQGIDVAAAPCLMRSDRPLRVWVDLVPSADAILLNEGALHEWVGLAWYKLSGKI